MSVPSPHLSWRRSQGWAFVSDDHRTVLLNLADTLAARPILLSGPATSLWRACEQERSIPELVELLVVEYGLATTEAVDAVPQLLSELQSAGLLEQTPKHG